MIKKGVKTARFNLAESKRLWLSLILSIICAALVCCAFIVPNLNKKAIAAVQPNVVPNQVVYTSTYSGKYAPRNTPSSWAIGSFSAPNSTYNAYWDSANKKAIITKPSQNEYSFSGVVAVKAEIEVPAMTEYKITFNYTAAISKSSKGSGTAWSGTELMYFGNTFDDPNAQDQTASLTYRMASSTATGSYNGYTTVGHVKNGGKASITGSVSTNPVTVTYTNTSKQAETYTAYFAVVAGVNSANSSSTANKFTGTCTFNEKLTVTPVTTPSLDKTTDTYSESGNDFTLLDWDPKRVALTSYTYKDVNGNIQTLYSYSNDESEVETGTNPLDGTTILKPTKAGTYTLTFNIYYWCGAVWDSATNDQSEKTISFTVSPKKITIGWTNQQYEEGEGADSLFFMLPTLSVTQNVQQLLKDNAAGNGKEEYYLKENYNISTGEATGTPVTKIEKDKDYYVTVQLKDGIDPDNYEITGDFYSYFSTKDTRTVIVVTVTNSGVVYNGTPQSVALDVVTVDGDPVAVDFECTYFMDGDDVYESGSTVVPTNAGTYTVTAKIKPAGSSEYKPADKLEFEFVIEKADPDCKPVLEDSTATLYSGSELPKIIYDKTEGGTEGTYEWAAGQKLITGEYDYSYIFTPSDANIGNYNTYKGTFNLEAVDAQIKSITAEWKYTDDDGNLLDENGDPVIIYDSWTKDLENKLKPYLTVTGVYENGTDTTEIRKDKYELSGVLKAGEESTITVKYGDLEYELKIDGIAANAFKELVVRQTAGADIYTSTDVYQLSNILVVKATYLDGSEEVIDENRYEFTIYNTDDEEIEDIVSGKIKIAVTSKVDGETRTSEKISFTVKEVELDSLEAEFDTKGLKITNTNVEALRDFLTVKGENNDGSDYNEGKEITEYTLSGKLEAGKTCKIKVSYEGISTTFEVYVEPNAVEVKAVPLPVPELKELFYTGNEIDFLSGWNYTEFVDVIGNKGTAAADDYTLKIVIKNPDAHYWNTSTLTPVKKALAKYALSVGYEGGYDIDGDTLTLTWSILPAVLSGTWNDQGKLELLSSSYKGETGNLVKYTYYKDGAEVDYDKLVEGETYTVTAELLDTDNFVFDGATAEIAVDHEFTMKAPPKDTSPLDKVKGFMLKTWLGIPVWAWLLIALAVLILLIIIIAVACKRRKSKEEKAEAKARKEEERERREEERRLQKEKLEAERELAKAKQEAELEKMRAQAQMAAGMGMASMAMQQPQQMPQPQMQQPQDDSAMRRMQDEIAELRAKLAAGQQTAPAAMPQQAGGDMNAVMFAKIEAEIAALRAGQNMQQPQYFQQPMQMPVQQNDANAAVMLAKMEAEFAKMQLEFYKMHSGMPINYAPQIPAPQVQMLPQNVQEITQPIQTQYPSDAVVTTTMTVDTTQKPSPRRSGRGSRDDFADVDGFYDSID